MNVASASSRARRATGAPIFALLLTGLALAVGLVPAARAALCYDTEALAGGAWWRVVTCHWVHAGWSHLIWDAAAFLLLAVLCERESRGRFLFCLAGSVVAIPAALGWLQPGLALYGGLSGLASALFALLVTRIAQEGVAERAWGRVAIAGILLAAFGTKVGFEAVTGQTVFVGHDLLPVPLAHAVGAAIGLATGFKIGGHTRSRNEATACT